MVVVGRNTGRESIPWLRQNSQSTTHPLFATLQSPNRDRLATWPFARAVERMPPAAIEIRANQWELEPRSPKASSAHTGDSPDHHCSSPRYPHYASCATTDHHARWTMIWNTPWQSSHRRRCGIAMTRAKLPRVSTKLLDCEAYLSRIDPKRIHKVGSSRGVVTGPVNKGIHIAKRVNGDGATVVLERRDFAR
jgi:hypothetical protein